MTSKRYKQEEKEEILEYANNHTIREACEKFGVSKYSINKWKGWIRKNVREANKKWYATKGKEYYSRPENIQKNRESTERWKRENPEKSKEVHRKSKRRKRFRVLCEYANRTYRRKGLECDYELQPIDLFHIAKKQKLKCAMSGRKLTNDNISLDHIIPISKGGSNKPENLRLLTYHVNIALHVLSDEEFISICQDVVDKAAQ